MKEMTNIKVLKASIEDVVHHAGRYDSYGSDETLYKVKLDKDTIGQVAEEAHCDNAKLSNFILSVEMDNDTNRTSYYLHFTAQFEGEVPYTKGIKLTLKEGYSMECGAKAAIQKAKNSYELE